MARASPALATLLLLSLTPAWVACGANGADDAEIAVRVETVAMDHDTRSPVVILEEVNGSRRLPIWIGHAEAGSIDSRLREEPAIRPNTHDLATRLIDGLDGEVLRVVVTDLEGGIYYARIVLERSGQILEIDSRPSDAIAIALRTGAPVFVTEPLFSRTLEASSEAHEGKRI